jgi:hypothetical protein
MHHWKNYEPIEGVMMFDSAGAGPSSEHVSVTANCSSSDTYPECRIAVHFGRLASGALTVEQSAQLRAYLEQAERDVAAGRAKGTQSPEDEQAAAIASDAIDDVLLDAAGKERCDGRD